MGSDKLLRVTQTNAIFLDNEIYKSFLRIIQDASRNLPPGFIAPFEPEIALVLRLALLKNSVYRNGQTFGQALLSIKYEQISDFKKCLYILAYCSEYVKNRLELWKPTHKLNRTFFKIHVLISIFNFINMSIFLRHGVKPLLIERILGLNQVYTQDSAPRQFESKYMARELLWNGFIEILVHVLPLINFHKIKRTVKYYNPFHHRSSYVVLNNRVMTMHSKCAHCVESPILPHHMGCAHIFCYVCLKGNQTADPRYECPICEHRNPNVLCDKVVVI